MPQPFEEFEQLPATPMPTFSVVIEEARVATSEPQGGAQAQSVTVEPSLSHDALMEAAGVPVEWRADLDVIVECESRWNPGAVGDHGNSLGAGQINWATWFPYALDLGLVEEADRPHWDDPVINLKVAVGVVRYDIARGYPMWAQWSCQP